MIAVDELITWLRQQLDEDERVARDAANYGVAWRNSDGSIYPSDESRHPGAMITGVYGDLEDRYAEHIARWDPARVLAEVEAKRRILDMYADYTAERRHLAPVIWALAQPYAGRPGWREEWRLDTHRDGS